MKLKTVMKNIAAITLGAAMILSVGCSNKSSSGNVDEITLTEGDTIAVIEVEGYGTIKAKLFPDIVPIGVKNFVDLAASEYYTGKTFHRVISDFMIQGGSENGDGTGGTAADGGKFSIETSDKAYHFYGALCYANAGPDENTCQFYIVNNKTGVDTDEQAKYFTQLAEQYKDTLTASQIEYYTNLSTRFTAYPQNVKDKYKTVGGVPYLDGDYTVFGQVIEGMDIVDAISICEVEEGFDGAVSKPVDEILISSVKIETYTAPVETSAQEESNTNLQ